VMMFMRTPRPLCIRRCRSRNDRWRMLTSLLLLVMPSAGVVAQTATISCGAGGSAGGGMKVHGTDVVFSIKSDSTDFTVLGLVVVRVPQQFRRTSARRSQPPQWGHRLISGGTAGPLWIGHEESTNTVWIDSMAVPLDTNNVLLVQVDARNTLHIAGQARIDARVPVPNACDGATVERRHAVFRDSLWARFQNSPQVRAFLSR
jgi:hypothetical protein